MKKTILILCIAVLTLNSCGTLVGGSRSCRHKPEQGHRHIRIVPIICDLIFFTPIGLGIDILDGAIYKPCK